MTAIALPTPKGERASAPLRFALYARISSDEEKRGRGVRAQRALLLRTVQRRELHGETVTVVDIYEDNDRSAFIARQRRDQYDRLMADARAGRFDVVIARALNRFWRDEDRCKQMVNELTSLGIAVVTVKGGQVDLNSHAGRKHFRQEILDDEMESDQTSERVRDSLLERQLIAEKVRDDVTYGGSRRVYGYRDDAKGRRVKVPEEAAVIREVADRLLHGEALLTIATDLNRRGLRSITGRTWKAQTLRVVMLSPRHAGLALHRRDGVARHVEKTWEPIIDRETFEGVCGVLERRSRPTRARTYPLSGLLQCGRCGETLVAQRNTQGIRKYRCYHEGADGHRGCGHNVIDAEAIETWLARQLFTASRKLASKRRGVATSKVGTAIGAELDKLEARKRDAQHRFVTGQWDSEFVDGILAEINAALAAARQRQAELLSTSPLDSYLGNDGSDLEQAWDQLDAVQQATLLRSALKPGQRIPIQPHDGDRAEPRRGGAWPKLPIEERVLPGAVPWRH